MKQHATYLSSQLNRNQARSSAGSDLSGRSEVCIIHVI